MAEYTVYVSPEEMKNNEIYAQHTGVGFGDDLVSMPYMMLVYATHGGGSFRIGDECGEFCEGDIVLIQANTENCFYTTSAHNGLSMYFCVFEESLFNNYLLKKKSEFKELGLFFDKTIPFLYTHDTQNKQIRNMMVRILDEFSYAKSNYREVVKAMLSVVLTDVCRLCEMGYYAEAHMYSNKTMGEIVNYVNKNLYKRLSLSSTAKHLHISTQYICRLFKKYMGITYTDYVNKKRVELIKNEIENTDRPIFLVCGDFEFSGAYLNEIFKKQTNYSIKEYKSKFNYKAGNPLYR